MPVFHDLKAVQVHIPKTAGTTTSHILGIVREDLISLDQQRHWLFGEHGLVRHGQPYQHITSTQIKKEIGSDKFKEYFKFSFVRNPWDRVISELFWTNSFRPKIDNRRKITLDQFLRTLKNRKPIRMRSQKNYLYINDKLSVDFLGRYEDLTSDFIKICSELDFPLYEPPTQNLGSLINNTSEEVYIQEHNGPVFKLMPKENIKAFKINSPGKSFLIKYANSIKDLKSGSSKTIQVDRYIIDNYIKMNVPYVHSIDSEELPIISFEYDEFARFNYSFCPPDPISYNLTNLKIDSFHFNKINRKNYREYYNDKTKKLVAEIYEDDIDTFKYTF